MKIKNWLSIVFLVSFGLTAFETRASVNLPHERGSKKLRFQHAPVGERVDLIDGDLTYIAPKQDSGKPRRLYVRERVEGATELKVDELVLSKGYAFAIATKPDATKRLFEIGFLENSNSANLPFIAGGFGGTLLGVGILANGFLDHSLYSLAIGGSATLFSAALLIRVNRSMSSRDIIVNPVGDADGNFALSHVERDPTTGDVQDFILESADGPVRYSSLQKTNLCMLLLRGPRDLVVQDR